MKIKYINSFGPPEYVELKDNNIGIVFSEKETKGVELSDDKIDLFWQTINEIDVWNWKREYSPEEEMLDAISYGHKAIKDQIQAQISLANSIGKIKTRSYEEENSEIDLQKEIFLYNIKWVCGPLRASHFSFHPEMSRPNSRRWPCSR